MAGRGRRRSPLTPRRFVPAVVFIIAGLVALAVGGDDTTADAIALALMGIGGVLGVAAAFFEIGASEDRDRRAGRS
jgi:hypothetical protein